VFSNIVYLLLERVARTIKGGLLGKNDKPSWHTETHQTEMATRCATIMDVRFETRGVPPPKLPILRLIRRWFPPLRFARHGTRKQKNGAAIH